MKLKWKGRKKRSFSVQLSWMRSCLVNSKEDLATALAKLL